MGDMRIVRRTFVKGALASTAALFAPHVSRAQDWPNRPVRFIVHLAAGGGLDFIARLVGEPVSRSIGQQVFIENRTGGAGGTIGIEAGIKSPDDGYNFLIANDEWKRQAPEILIDQPLKRIHAVHRPAKIFAFMVCEPFTARRDIGGYPGTLPRFRRRAHSRFGSIPHQGPGSLHLTVVDDGNA